MTGLGLSLCVLGVLARLVLGLKICAGGDRSTEYTEFFIFKLPPRRPQRLRGELKARPSRAAAAFVFFAAAARARVVSSSLPDRCLRIGGAHDFHEVFRR